MRDKDIASADVAHKYRQRNNDVFIAYITDLKNTSMLHSRGLESESPGERIVTTGHKRYITGDQKNVWAGIQEGIPEDQCHVPSDNQVGVSWVRKIVTPDDQVDISVDEQNKPSGHHMDISRHQANVQGCHMIDISVGQTNDQADQRMVMSKGQTEEANGSISHQKQTSGRYWKVMSVISCFFANLFMGGLYNYYGILYIYMQESLGVSEYQLSWIGSLMGGSFGVAAILATVFVETIGCRITTLAGGLILSTSVMISSLTSSIFLLYLTLGVLPGIGLVLCYVATTVHVTQQFSRWLPLATGVSATGCAVGVLLWPSLMVGIADSFGWRGTLLIQGALLLHMAPAGLWIRDNHKKAYTKSIGQTKQTECFFNLVQAFKLPGSVCFCIGPFFNGLGVYAYSTFTPQYAMTILPDMTTSDAALIISLFGVGTLIGRLLFSSLTMVKEHFALPIYLVTNIICGVLDMTVTLCQDMTGFFITGALYGLAFGGWWTVYSLVLLKQFGIKNLPKMLGIFVLSQGVGSACGPSLQSYLATVTNQNIIFYMAGTFYIVGILVMLPLVLDKNQFLPRRRKSVTLTVFSVS